MFAIKRKLVFAVSAYAPLSRRDALMRGFATCCVPAWVAAVPRVVIRPWATEEVAPGIHIRRGVDEDASASNDDAIANIGFIVGRDAVAVTDPGGSLSDGRRLRESIRLATQLPIRYVLMSHVHPDHVFGAGAFRADDPVYVGHAGLPRALSLRWEYYRTRTEAILGKDTVGAVVMPAMLVHDHAKIDLGARVLDLSAHGIAHTDSDLTVLDRQTGTLIASDLLFVRRVPSLDGSLKGWLKELALLKGVAAQRAVPGHGPTSVDWPLGCRDLERYLGVLLRETRAAIAKGLDIEAAVKTVGQSERARWALFDDYNGHNVIQAFKELEWE
jgi:quinoprotein relay system zinc metallohydrolase 2